MGLANTGRDVVGESQDDRGIHVGSEVSTDSKVSSEGEQVIHGAAVRLTTESILEDLVASQEVLRAATITEAHLLNQGVAPATRKGETSVGTGQIRSEGELADNILDTILGRNSEDGRAAGKVVEVLGVFGVLGGRPALLGGRLVVVVVKIYAFSNTHLALN